MDACALPFLFEFLVYPWALVTSATFAFLLVISICSVPQERRALVFFLGIGFGVLAWGSAARAECRSAEDTGGWNAPVVSAIVNVPDSSAGFPLSITNDEKLPLKDVRITIAKISRQPDGRIAIENPFFEGQQMNVGTVSPQFSAIRLNVALQLGTYEILITTSRGAFAERIRIFEENGQVRTSYYIRDQIKDSIVMELEPGAANNK